MENSSISGAFDRLVATGPALPAIVLQAHPISFGQLGALSRAFARRMTDAGVRPGNLICLNTVDMVVVFAALIGAARLGAQVVFASNLLARTQAVKPDFFFKSPEVTGSERVQFLDIDQSWAPDAAAGDFDPAPEPVRDEDANWLILHSTGTSGRPKFLALSQRIMLGRAKTSADQITPGETRMASLFDCTSRPFLVRAFSVLLNGGAIVNINEPQKWQMAGVTYACGSPKQISTDLADIQFEPKLPLLESSGARLPRSEIINHLSNFYTVRNAYGSGEAGRTFETEFRWDRNGDLIRSVSDTSADIQIVGPDEQPVPPGESGVVRVRTPNMIAGYIDDPDQTARSFRNGWFYPGDEGRFASDGVLEILGRSDNVINIGGSKLDLGRIDAAVASAIGVGETVAFASPPQVRDYDVVSVVTLSGEATLEQAAEAASRECRSALGNLCPTILFHQATELEKTSKGEISRLREREKFVQQCADHAAQTGPR